MAIRTSSAVGRCGDFLLFQATSCDRVQDHWRLAA